MTGDRKRYVCGVCGCEEVATRTFQMHAGRLRFTVPLCDRHAEDAVATRPEVRPVTTRPEVQRPRRPLPSPELR